MKHIPIRRILSLSLTALSLTSLHAVDTVSYHETSSSFEESSCCEESLSSGVKNEWHSLLSSWGGHEELKVWVDEVIDLCQPMNVELIDGSDECVASLKQLLLQKGTLAALHQDLWPDCYIARSHPDDVARVEERTFIASKEKENAGPTNNWMNPDTAKSTLKELFKGCMAGRTMYVIPFAMGPIDSPYAKVAVEITDSAYVALSLTTMTRTGKEVFARLPEAHFAKCLHSVGRSQKDQEIATSSEENNPWPCDPERVHIVHFPEELAVWSYGSGYGGNALLNKKCFALRLASFMGKHEGWLAEHMLCIKVTNPEGRSKYFLAAFPSACGKTNLAMLHAPESGWKVECIGDDIAWLHWAKDGSLRAINPEFGFFGVVPGTSYATNPVAMDTINRGTIFTNVATTDTMEPWWEGKTKELPTSLTSWKNTAWTPNSLEPAAHPNSRFTTPLSNCPSLAPEWNDPQGVPVSAIIFGGRRATTIPLVREAFSWNHGVFMGAALSSETTSAAKGATGVLRHDPFAMLPFCGYNMADYFGHWVAMGNTVDSKLHPKFYTVNWFLRDTASQNQFAWPGFGENVRVLEWIFNRCDQSAKGVMSPIGILPDSRDLSLPSEVSPSKAQRLFTVDQSEWKKEVEELKRYFSQFGDRMPDALMEELSRLECCFTHDESDILEREISQN